VRNKLDLLGRQELPSQVRERVEAHLSVCADCRRRLARQTRLASLLKSLPEPLPVPEGFGDRLMAAARARQAGCRLAPGALWGFRWLSPSGSIGSKAAHAVALAGGLLIGVFMAQQTWRYGHRLSPQTTTEPDPVVVCHLDYLTDAPGGDLAQSYLTLTEAPKQNGT
jgi:anti-sigma factor RsiW